MLTGCDGPYPTLGKLWGETLLPCDCQIKAKDFSSAMKDYDRAIKANPNNADAYYNRGLAKKLMKQPHCEDWKKATELGSTAARDRMKECE